MKLSVRLECILSSIIKDAKLIPLALWVFELKVDRVRLSDVNKVLISLIQITQRAGYFF